ncbi:MAG TPA: hypothetical protein PLK34_00330 [Candidatus Pacearchaeota archaeon]|nr:hypothetical protein [Candidatus Pacearchaeota archaeon]
MKLNSTKSGLSKEQLISKIIEKKEFSDLPIVDIENVFNKLNKPHYSDEEKIKLSRDMLRKIFSGFSSQKIFSLKDKSPEWHLSKHLSTRERLPYFSEIYSKIFSGLPKKISVIDLGAGINGLSYSFFQEAGFKVDYTAVESVGQLVNVMNDFFSKEKISAQAIKMSLFELEKLEKIIQKTSTPRVAFLFKVIDSLEAVQSDYSKKLIEILMNSCERVVVSFATESMIKRTKFKANRNWIIEFLAQNFKILDDFSFGGEKFFVIAKKK